MRLCSRPTFRILLLLLLACLVYYAGNLPLVDDAVAPSPGGSGVAVRGAAAALTSSQPAPLPPPPALAAQPAPSPQQLLAQPPALAPPPPLPPPPAPAPAPRRFLRPSECCPQGALHVAFVATSPEHLQRAFRVLADLAPLPTGGAPVVAHLLASPECLGVPLLSARDAAGAPFPAAYTYLDATSALAVPGLSRLCSEFANTNKACLYLLKPFLYALLPRAVEAVLVLDVDLRVLPGGGGLRELLGAGALRALRRSGALAALARELQPTYLRVGMRQGFNGGVQVLDLRAQRASALYTSFLATFSFAAPPAHARFRHNLDLGDQTLYSILNETHPSAIAELPCGWNLNLCQYWRAQEGGGAWGREASLAGCQGGVRLVHGNGQEYQRLGMEGMEQGGLQALVEAQRSQSAAEA